MIDKDIKELESTLKTNINTGLSTSKAEVLLKKNGPNTLKNKKKMNIIIKFIMEFNDILIVILLISAMISYIVDPTSMIESIIILFVVVTNALLGVIQESKAEKSLEALVKLSGKTAKVYRDNKLTLIESTKLVIGDIIEISAGDYISADCRIIDSKDLKVDESSLTGESNSVSKHPSVLLDKTLSIGDQTNMVFSATFVTEGFAKCIVVKTGMQTEVGKIANLLLDNEEPKTPLQIRLDHMAKIIGIIALIICAIVFVLESIITKDYLMSFKSAISLAVAAIPEGLSTVVTIILAIGVSKMVKEKAIVKKLPAVETLGSTTVVCSDKTGTLTLNKMSVTTVVDRNRKINHIKYLSDEALDVLKYMYMCSNAKITTDKLDKTKTTRVGNSTELAVVEAYLNNKKEEKSYTKIDEILFDSKRKMMSVLVKEDNDYYIITKGAIDIVINRCKDFDKVAFNNINKELASKSLRVLAVAIKKVSFKKSITLEDENNLTFIGMVGIIDPVKEEAKEAIKVAKNAGVRTIMITGDHKITATAIAKELDIIKSDEEVLSSQELNKLSDDNLYDNIEKYGAYARVSPLDKLRIVKTWQRKGHVVAMTGDGVNDSPALKQANIGCAMGITGTDVSKEAASMIIVDDNYATIITAIKEGRGIYDNIRKTIWYLLSSNIGEVVTIFFASIISLLFIKDFGIPLSPIHLLWINLVTDLLPAFAIGLEKTDASVMLEKPRKKSESFFSHGLWYTILWQGFLIGLVALFAYYIGSRSYHLKGSTMAFLTLSTLQLLHGFNVKSKKSIFDKQIFNNIYLILSLILGLSLELFLVYNKTLRGFFNLDLLTISDLLICFWLSFSILIVVEITKIYHNKKEKRKK